MFVVLVGIIKKEKEGLEWEEVKLFLFKDDMIMYLKDGIDFIEKYVDFVNILNKVIGYKIRI